MDFLLNNNNNNTLVNNNTKLLRWSIFQNIHYSIDSRIQFDLQLFEIEVAKMSVVHRRRRVYLLDSVTCTKTRNGTRHGGRVLFIALDGDHR